MYLAQATGDKWLVDINSDKGATAIAQSLNAEEQARQAEYLKVSSGVADCPHGVGAFS